MKVLIVGDIVGAPGRKVFAHVVKRHKTAGSADFVVANAENAAGGRGVTPAVAEELFSAGADVLTLGDHAWDQKDLVGYMASEERLLRPANFAPGCPGRGCISMQSAWGPITVISLIGRVFMKPAECPFRTLDALLASRPAERGIVIVDFHAEATSEKIVMGRYADGRVSVVVGSHTHVQTSDECILPGGTAYITDLGMTGPKDSAIGRDLDQVLTMFLTGMPSGFKLARNKCAVEGVIVDVDRTSGQAKSIVRIRDADAAEERSP
jgi:metallophosphoesterase (TIGR00282 family)